MQSLAMASQWFILLTDHTGNDANTIASDQPPQQVISRVNPISIDFYPYLTAQAELNTSVVVSDQLSLDGGYLSILSKVATRWI